VDCQLVEAPQHNHGSVNRSLGDPQDEVTQAMERFHDAIRKQRDSLPEGLRDSIAP
jgi:hypothetical protein